MSDKYEDLRSFLDAARRFGNCGLTVEEIMRAINPRPRPFEETNPNLWLLTRFALIAGVHWNVYGTSPTEYRFEAFPGSRVRWTIVSEKEAAAWLDSPEALDAAAIVAVRKGGGIRTVCRLGIANEYEVSVFAKGFSGYFSDEAKSRSRAAVLACLKAFEEKS